MLPLEPVQLSADIVQIIFTEFSMTLSTERVYQFPWFLGQICSSWRSIFLSMTAHFWRKISISLSPFWYYKHQTEVVRFFLERDPESPFSFHFTLNPLMAEESSDLHDILEMLVNESTRWTDVTLSCIRSGSYMLPLDRVKGRLPLLNTLYLYMAKAPQELHSIFQIAPSLTIVDIYGLDNWKFDWSKVKQLKIHCFYDIEAWDAHQHGVNFLPCLTALYCNPGWLPYLTAPGLEDLTIYLGGSDTAVNLQSFVSRSSCNILHLTIESTPGSIALEAVRHAPHIVYLGLALVVNVGLVLGQLFKSTNPGRGPLARHMVLFDMHSDADSTEAKQLYDLILSRTSTATDEYGYERIQKLGLMCNYTTGPMKDVITLCERQGIQMSYLPSKSAVLTMDF